MPLTEEEKAKVEEEEALRTEIRKKKEKKEQSRKSIGCLVLIIVIVVFIAILSGMGGEKKSPSSTSPMETHSNAFMLASLEVGNTNPQTSLVNSFDVLLKDLTKKCPKETESQISDYIVAAKEMIEKKGKEITLLEIGNAMNESIPEDAIGIVTCKETTAALIVLLTAE